MAVITISHEMGAGGPEIGMALAQRLGYRYIDHELILDAVRRYGLEQEKLSHLDESKPTLFERFDSETRHYITVLQTTLLEFAEKDNAILMGRGGNDIIDGDAWLHVALTPDGQIIREIRTDITAGDVDVAVYLSLIHI